MTFAPHLEATRPTTIIFEHQHLLSCGDAAFYDSLFLSSHFFQDPTVHNSRHEEN
jgi:hypothetical protein